MFTSDSSYGSIHLAEHRRALKKSSKRDQGSNFKAAYFTFLAGLGVLIITSFAFFMIFSSNESVTAALPSELASSSLPLQELSLSKKNEDDFLIVAWDPENEEHWAAANKLRELGFDPNVIPDEFDWSQQDGIVTPIKDQGDYGSCWAFGSSATMESAWAIAGNKLEKISVQQILDCVEPKEKKGKFCLGGDCKYEDADRPYSGGDGQDAYRYWYHNGFVAAKDYTYIHAICKSRQMLGGSGKEVTEENLKMHCEAHDACYWNHTEYLRTTPADFWVHRSPQPCRNVNTDNWKAILQGQQCKTKDVKHKTLGRTRGYYDIANFETGIGVDEEKMRKAVYLHGPVNVGMYAYSFLHFPGGIIDFDSKECPNGPDDLDHSLSVVGYGTENGVDYWKVRNSWGPFYGENGYLRVKRGANVCGIGLQVLGLIV